MSRACLEVEGSVSPKAVIFHVTEAPRPAHSIPRNELTENKMCGCIHEQRERKK
jgi:hypothetical protein